MNKPPSIYKTRFLVVCISSLFFSASFNMLIPELPAYLSILGGAEYKGLIISLFTLTAAISRPFSGKLTDTIGRKPVMIIGVLVSLVCGFLYPVMITVSGFLFLRLLHGFSTGFSPTAIAAYVADSIPKDRLGEALGIQGLCFSAGLALGPALGSFIKLYYSFNVLFYSSSFIAFVSFLLIINLRESLLKTKFMKSSIFQFSRHDFFAKEVLPSATVTFFTYIAFGVILTIIADWSEHLGIINKGTFFIVFTLSSLCVRFIAGKTSDIYGRSIVIKMGLIVLILSLLIIGYFNNSIGLLIGSGFYGLAMGVLSPALNAWTIDMSHPDHRGKAMATMYISLEVGIGLGAFFSGWYYQDDMYRIPIIIYTCALMAVLAFVYMLFKPISRH
ncbi:MFS transporter [Aquimarina longa]|uniref:MFS transporter n=1 Tax=Aquimarina longa TaxID=1080221 RepID=UPI0007855577|nr:MFS transporter [Aquimarina longa]